MVIHTNEMTYKCQSCGMEVRLEGGVIKRACAHLSSPITADIRATVFGLASLGKAFEKEVQVRAITIAQPDVVEEKPAEEKPAEEKATEEVVTSLSQI